MDPQIIIVGLAGAVSGLAGTIFKILLDIIKEKNTTIAQQDKTIDDARRIQDSTTQTLQAMVNAGLERLPSPPGDSTGGRNT